MSMSPESIRKAAETKRRNREFEAELRREIEDFRFDSLCLRDEREDQR